MSDVTELAARLDEWSRDDTKGDGMLLRQAADKLLELEAERDELQAYIDAAPPSHSEYLEFSGVYFVWYNDRPRQEKAKKP